MSDAVALVQRELFLRSTFGTDLAPRFAQEVTSLMRDVLAPEGSALYEAGRPADRIYFIVEGAVELRDGVSEARHFGPQSVVGIIDASQGRVYSRTAVAAKDVRAIMIDYADYLELLEENFEFVEQLFSRSTSDLWEFAQGLSLSQMLDGSAAAAEPSLTFEWPERPLNFVEKLRALRMCPPLQRAPVQALARLVERCREQRVDIGTSLFAPCDPVKTMFALVQGSVQLTHSDNGSATCVAPALVGGVAVFGRKRHVLRAETHEPSLLLATRLEDVLDVAEDHFGLARSMFYWLGWERERVANAVAASSTQIKDDPSATSDRYRERDASR